MDESDSLQIKANLTTLMETIAATGALHWKLSVRRTAYCLSSSVRVVLTASNFVCVFVALYETQYSLLFGQR